MAGLGGSTIVTRSFRNEGASRAVHGGDGDAFTWLEWRGALRRTRVVVGTGSDGRVWQCAGAFCLGAIPAWGGTVSDGGNDRQQRRHGHDRLFDVEQRRNSPVTLS